MKAEPLAARGAVIAETAADLGTADVVFVTVGSSDDLIEAILGPNGLIEGPSAPAIVVDCSTVSTEASQQIRIGSPHAAPPARRPAGGAERPGGAAAVDHGVVLENGRVRLAGSGQEVLGHPEIGSFYLGGTSGTQ